jgi:hypothetical protein
MVSASQLMQAILGPGSDEREAGQLLAEAQETGGAAHDHVDAQGSHHRGVDQRIGADCLGFGQQLARFPLIRAIPCPRPGRSCWPI